MPSKNDNAALESLELDEVELSIEDLEASLETELELQLSELSFLKEEREKIGSPDNLGNIIMDVVWEQFLNQVAVTAGEDFIKENNGLHLDLRKEAHIQTTENFTNGKIASHNTEVDFQERYDKWQSNFVKDTNGKVVMHDTRINEVDSNGNIIIDNDGKPVKKKVETLVSGYRDPYDKVRNQRGLRGSKEKGTAMDETIAVGTIVRDPQANAFMTEEERIEFDLSDKNLNEIDSRWNSSKGDTPTDEWLDNTNSKGQTPREIFDNMDEQSEKQLLGKYVEAEEEFEKRKNEAEQKAIVAGKKSQKKEAFRIGGKALRAVLMQLLAELVRDIIAKLVKWFRSAKKTLDTLLNSLKEAIHSFISKMKQHLINAGNTLFTTVATAIWGPIVGTIKKVWMMLKQGWSSLKNAIAYIKDPANKGKSIGRLLMEVGKIVIAGMTGIGAMALGEVIEKGLMTIPIFAFEIPLLGSLANILGIFLGAVVAGIIGAIAINIIEKQIEKSMKRENVDAQIKKGNEILDTQDKLINVKVQKMVNTKEKAADSMKETREQAKEIIADAMTTIFYEDKGEDQSNSDRLKSTAADLAWLRE